MPENTEGRSQIVVASNDGVVSVPVRPIPDRDLWFERVWKAHTEKISRKQT
jgi:hypothetical protein